MSSPTRRAFLKTIGGAGLFCAAPRIARAAGALADPPSPGFGVTSDVVQISILHTTDLHGRILPTNDYAGNVDLGGFARCVTQIRRWRRQNRNSILIDAGDVYQGTDVSLRTNGALMIDLFNHLRYDAWIVGNHEFDWGVELSSTQSRDRECRCSQPTCQSKEKSRFPIPTIRSRKFSPTF